MDRDVHRVRLELDSMEFGRGVLDKSVLALPAPRQERVLAELSPFLMERTASEPATQRSVCRPGVGWGWTETCNGKRRKFSFRI